MAAAANSTTQGLLKFAHCANGSDGEEPLTSSGEDADIEAEDEDDAVSAASYNLGCELDLRLPKKIFTQDAAAVAVSVGSGTQTMSAVVSATAAAMAASAVGPLASLVNGLTGLPLPAFQSNFASSMGLERDLFKQRELMLAQREFMGQQDFLVREALLCHRQGLPLPLGIPPLPYLLHSHQQQQMASSPGSEDSMLEQDETEFMERQSTPNKNNESLPNNNDNNNNRNIVNTGTGVASDSSRHWTFEEQFKQLYELSDDNKRKEFLDDLFAYMQKRGTPVNRIPIMAKQVLDLYELFRLVVSKGGLVDVINKKLWREITKGLNLPSSITSAAFTLRTQYMKYLYPYECEKLKLSNPSELQTAIDGNRREGRRPSYSAFDCASSEGLAASAAAAAVAAAQHHHHHQQQQKQQNHNSSLTQHSMKRNNVVLMQNLSNPLLGERSTALTCLSPAARYHEDRCFRDSPCSDISSFGELSLPLNLNTSSATSTLPPTSQAPQPTPPASSLPMDLAGRRPLLTLPLHKSEDSLEKPTSKRLALDMASCLLPVSRSSPSTATPGGPSFPTTALAGALHGIPFSGMQSFPHVPLSTANIRISSHGQHGHLGISDTTVMVTMDMNGMMYHGVLFAQPKHL